MLASRMGFRGRVPVPLHREEQAGGGLWRRRCDRTVGIAVITVAAAVWHTYARSLMDDVRLVV
jgi:uncharacterized membrane protein